MLTIENLKVFNLEGALRGMRFPMQSNSKSDSEWNYAYAGFPDEDYIIGDMALAQKLIKAGEPTASLCVRYWYLWILLVRFTS